MNLILLLLLLGLRQDSSSGEPPTLTNFSRNFSDKDSLVLAHMDSVYMLKPCNKSREIIQNSWWGRISDGPLNYAADMTCEWLIKAPPGYWINLFIDRVRTECSYDYLFIFDGASYLPGQSKLLASFSGASDPHVNILAESGNMLILLYSDPNYVLEGFNFEYSLDLCPLNCSGAGDCLRIKNKGVCNCEFNRSGVGCEKIVGKDEDTRIVLASSFQHELARVGHTLSRIGDMVWIFGGFDLNIVLDNLVTFDLQSGIIKRLGNYSNKTTKLWPLGRFAHAVAAFKTGFFIHGGKGRDGTIYKDLFYYNTTSLDWTEFIPEENKPIHIPSLMYHTMTVTPSDNIYVFGGATENGEFSSTLYVYDANSPSNWSIVKSSCCGKQIQRRVLGHTMAYYAQINALILFGGVGSSEVGHFSKLSSQLWMFMINTSTWLHVDYKNNGGTPPGIYPERAFHTAHVVDQYLIIYGGYHHIHNKSETCYSNDIISYNLECQLFLPIVPPSSSNEYKPVFGHKSAVLRTDFQDFLVIIGGYRGYLSQSIRKVPFPFTKSKIAECSLFDRWHCSTEPKCGYCPTTGKCLDKYTGAENCKTNLQTTQCPGLCPVLTTCQSCTTVIGCVWCGSLEKCWRKEEIGGRNSVCNNPLETSLQCSEKSWKGGATQFEYRFPPNFSNPDGVKVINSSVLLITREYGTIIPAPVTFALRGSLVGSHPIKKLEMCALLAAVNLTLYSDSDEILNNAYRWADYQCYNLTWSSSGNPVYLVPGQTIKFNLVASSFGKGMNQEKSGRVTLQLKYYSGPISAPRILRKDHLIPFEGDSAMTDVNHCLLYVFCLPCAGDIACFWRTDTQLCIPRAISVKASYNHGLSLIANTSSLIIQPEDCPMCNDILFCGDCVNTKVHGLECEWWEQDMSCNRRGRLETAITQTNKCTEPCATRKNCTSCLSIGKCVWNEQKQECFTFSLFTSLYAYGQCYFWIDKLDDCKRCDKQPTCQNCILNVGCGWSYNENGGSCMKGDFGGPYLSNELIPSVPLGIENGVNTWTYGECPDVNECELKIDDCHPNATCFNTPGSYVCSCDIGTIGDGKSECEQTCLEPCLNGICSPQFVCECDLGWTGSACSEDCLCNNHSSCSSGPGKCDKCQDYTTGLNCELCMEGSFGNATLLNVGCTLCQCNGHGNAEKGLCDPITGHCFCMNNTTGVDCSECSPGFYGSPSESRPCYEICSGRGIITGKRQGFFGLPPDMGSSFISRKRQQMMQQRNTSFAYIEHCMWIIEGEDMSKSTPSDEEGDEDATDSNKPKISGLLITIEKGFDVPCSHNVITVYKGYIDFGVKTVPLVAAICNEKEDPSNPTSIIVEGNVATIVLKYARMGSTKFSFNGSFKVLNENEMEHDGFHTVSKDNRGVPFNVSSLYDGTSPSFSVLSRFGHSIFGDHNNNNLYIFGGYSLNGGPLNDIRHFSVESSSWVPLTIIINQNEEAVPPARYFHGGAISPSNHMILIHGGISFNFTFLSDTWKFDLLKSRWSRVCDGVTELSPKLGGHTLTLRPFQGRLETMDEPFTVIIGGFNNEEGFSNKVYYMGSSECWIEVETTGSSPLGIYGHSTVYHTSTDSFFVFGGILFEHGSISTSSKLFVLSWSLKVWSILSPVEDYQLGPYPSPRFLHSSITTDDYMAVLGGIGSFNKEERNYAALIYVYQCNLWLSEDPKNLEISRVASATTIWDNKIFQMGGWKDGTTSETLLLLSIPPDPCSLQKTKSRCKGTLGCAYCSSNNNRSQQCYNADEDMPSSCSSGASNIEFWKGITCTSTWVSQTNCSRFNSCAECLATWPSHANTTQSCQWCTNGLNGRCIPFRKKFDDPCGSVIAQKQWAIADSNSCPERLCSSTKCEKCTMSGKCIWTRHITRTRERGFELRLQPVYDWNCVRKSILDTSPNMQVISPPTSCPIPCWHFDSCQECLESPGSEGGFNQCFWSVAEHRCISPAYSRLLCFGGICGPILRGFPSICPNTCATLRSCKTCLDLPSCGWCPNNENGGGVCVASDAMSESRCSNHSNSTYHFKSCPQENECINFHHECDLKSEQCTDLEEGYKCDCRLGYERSDTSCKPICPQGCVYGTCQEPGHCECNFGYVGQNCSARCDCNGHSNCFGIGTGIDICLDCQNNTMGPKCSQCKPFFVGDPVNNGQCIACSEYCNGHTTICLSHGDYNKWCNGSNSYLNSSQLMSTILSSGVHAGPTNQAFCCNCQNYSSGDSCNACIPGFFRGYDDKRLHCRKCECNGHGDRCDAVTGTQCNCGNNTESEHCSPNILKQNLQCYRHQCAKCKESYLGTPTNGHQCYMQMMMEEGYCFDAKSQESCIMNQKPLLSGRTVFFAIQPKFMNVNIKLKVDVTHGSINVFLSPKDDFVIIKQDEHSWVHRVDFDTKYGLTGDKEDTNIGKSTSFSGEYNNKLDIDYDIYNRTEDVDESGVNRIISKPPGVNSNPAYRLIMSYNVHEAASYATYYTVEDPKAVLLVRNLRNRLVITLPQSSHDLRLTRFYLVLEGIGDVSFGSIVFRQDQLHIDLFIFFSVFFSAFFLFLAGCGIAWKVKQNMETRRARRQHLESMMSMAKRPFAISTVLLQPDSSSGISEAYNFCRKSCRKGCICIRPMAVEWLCGSNNSNAICSMLISMPTGKSGGTSLCIGSVLANLHAPYQGRRRRLHH